MSALIFNELFDLIAISRFHKERIENRKHFSVKIKSHVFLASIFPPFLLYFSLQRYLKDESAQKNVNAYIFLFQWNNPDAGAR